jgi:small-conductance mechanosensitive channel
MLVAMHAIRTTSDRILTAADAVQSVPLLWAWAYVMVTNPFGQAMMLDLAKRLAMALVVGSAVAWGINRLLRRPMARLTEAALALTPVPVDPEERAEVGDLESEPTAGWQQLPLLVQRLWLAFAQFALMVLPLLGFVAAGHLVAFLMDGQPDNTLAILVVLGAYGLSAALVRAIDLLLAPKEPAVRLVPLEDATATSLMVWSRRIIVTGIGGFALAESGHLLGLSTVAYEALLRAVAFWITIGLAIMIVKQRRTVRAALRAPDGAEGVTAAARNHLAKGWHWIALAILASFWMDWVIDTGIPPEVIARYAALAAAVLAIGGLVLKGLLGAIEALTTVGPETAVRYPELTDRMALYGPAMRAVARVSVHCVTAMVIMQVFGIRVLTWLWESGSGQHIGTSLLHILVTFVVAIGIWELTNAAIQRHLQALSQGAQAPRSARIRTLLPLARTSLLIAVCIIVSLMVLSEIGVNIAPLLAGAGILGVAIGLGSQKLVQDVITGIFLLLDNALQVGDQVAVAGLSGKVEGLSVRTIRLRAPDGAVHIIPFSSVASVTNHSRGLGNADVRVTVELDNDPDRVFEVLQEIVAEMRTEPTYESLIKDDFKLFGVDKIDADGMTIIGQVACTDSGRWTVQREINRRIKQRFREVGLRFHNQPLALTD